MTEPLASPPALPAGTPPPLPPPPTQWEGGWRGLGMAAAAGVAFLAAIYWFVVPLIVSTAASQVPQASVAAIDEETLASLDRSVFQPTAADERRQAQLVARFSSLRPAGNAPQQSYRIVFRASKELGANAMALPGGTIVVTDGLMALSGDDDDLVAVLAHEAGHVDGRHGLRQLFQQSTITLFASWLLGDASMLAAAAPAALLQARYSRDLEREADRHAIAVLDVNDIPRVHFVRVLERLQASASAPAGGGMLEYLSSHPVTSDRIAAITAAGR